jgi:hypothetical protein
LVRRSGEKLENADELRLRYPADFGDFWLEERDAFLEKVDDLEGVVLVKVDSLCVEGEPLLVLGRVGVLLVLPPNMPPLNRPPFEEEPVERCILGLG